ncbi:hypothetical protein TRFO_15814 [Tritrichomonas foetus]|uniref:E3 ubiquitin-protein ligase n=1 Tax=Tritrichomonas foetus TaxID=1144522 RepID=A0A1J4KRM4_9EUKA|nr:hypothetical protein TRFO_15814 [Tritrichomonas foetus]|eukprot:OHT13919.1 hypothetical protein TRFO_15814 [Tritrichomonas foetus]
MNMDDEEYISLCSLFQTNVKMAIGYSEALLSENHVSFENFVADQISNSNPSSCQEAWSDRRIVIHCKECAISSSSCICLNCYNKSDHKNHHISIRSTFGGNCSCGNPLSWKETGFCQCHHSPDPNPESTQLSKELCDTLLIIFSSAFLDINFRAIYQPLDFIDICKWTKKLAGINDGFRRCIVIALLKKSDFRQLLLNIDAYDIDLNLAMVDLFMSLLTDKIFVIHFAQTVYKLQIDYVNLYLRFMRNKTKPKLLKPIINLTSHAYTPLVFTTILKTYDFDWTVLIVSFFQVIVKLLVKDPNGDLLYNSKLNRIAANVLLLSETAIGLVYDKQRCQSLFNALAVTFSLIEGHRPFIYLTPSEKADFTGLNTFNYWTAQLSFMFSSTKVPLMGDLIFTSIFRYFIDYFISDKFDNDKKVALFKRSIQGTALFSPIIPNHFFISTLFYQNRKNLLEYVNNYISGALSLNDFSLLLSILPLRWLAACHSSMTQIIPVASRGINFLVKNFMFENMIIYAFVPTFSLAQTCFGLMPQKDAFVAEMSFLYSLYEEIEDVTVKKNQRFAFLFMLVCLMTDKLCFEHDYIGIGRQMLKSLLFNKPQSVGVITRTIAPLCLDKMSLSDELSDLTERVTTKKGNLFKLKNEQTCHPFQPWQKISQVINHMSLAQQRNIDFISQFPEIRESEDGLTFSPALNSSTLKMWMYIILADSHVNPPLQSIETIHIVLNILLKLSKIVQFTPSVVAEKKIENYDVFRKTILEMDFYSFMWTPFELTFLKFPSISFVDLIVNLGYGSVLEKMNIDYHAPQNNSNPTDKPERAKARLLKDQIESDFKLRQKNFNLGTQDEIEAGSEVTCNICNIPCDDEQLCFPCLAYYTTIPSLIINSDNPIKTFCLRICPHLVHYNCVQISNETFRCPVDRMIRTCLLPRIKNGFEPLNLDQINLIRNFRKTPIFFTRTNNQYEGLVNSFVGTLLINEVRLRALPGCLDGNVNYMLIRNLFLMLWHSHHIENLTLTSDTGKWDYIKQLVSKMIVSDTPKESFFQTTKDIALSIKDEEEKLFLFLRRATLFEILALSDSAPAFVDCDDCLSHECLITKYFGSFEGKIEIELSPWSLFKLPKEFLDLSKPPYNFDIGNASAEVALCLLTGKLVSMERKGSSLIVLAEHLQENCHWNGTLLLLISGKKASTLCLAGKQFNSIRTLPGIYVDKFGDEDIGFSRGELLYLNEERLERYTDMLISGEWTDLDTPD